MSSFCASCVAEGVELVTDELDGKVVQLCRPCLEGEVRGGRWHFDDGSRPTEPRTGPGVQDGNARTPMRGRRR